MVEKKDILLFEEVKKKDVGIAGGKAANLGEMTQAKFPIPPGFIVTCAAYFKYLKEAGIEKKIISMADSIDVDNTAELKEKTQEIRGLIKGTLMSEELKKKIIEAYKKLEEKTAEKSVFVAVRSSASAEDLPSASFAGQQETYLNVSGNEELLESVQKCWASLFTARATYYRKKNNFKTKDVGIAVVVQKMVNSESAGVLFTADPTGDKSKIVIEGGFGLGEAVVSGSITPDTYVVEKESMEIVRKNIGKQQYSILRDEKGKNYHKKLGEEEAKKQKITDEQITKLAEIGKKIEGHYNAPQDIEWAIEAGKLYITQSRPVTTMGLKEKVGEAKEVEVAEERKLVKGLSGCPGIVSGIVKVVPSAEDVTKVGKGDILVTRMTNPDWVPIMKKAAGIITNEGGTTCFSGETKVLTNKGIKTFEDVYELIGNKEKLFALSLNPKTLKPEWKRINATMQRESNTIRINVSQTGRGKDNYVDLTANHRFMHFDNRKLIKKEISEIIKEGECVNTVDFIPAPNDFSEKNQKMAYLMGAIFTDGSIEVRKTKGRITFIQKETPEKEEFINCVKQYFKELFDVNMSVRERTYTSTIRDHTFTSTATAFTCSQKQIALEFQNAYEELNEWALTTDEENLKMFLGGVIDGDGSFNQAHGCRVHIYSGKEKVTEAVVLACLRLGIQPTLQKNRENCMNIQIIEGFDKILKYTKRVKNVPRKKIQGTKLFSAEQLLEDIKEECNWGGKIKPYIENNLLIDSEKIQKRVLPLLNYDTGKTLEKIISSSIRMKRVKMLQELCKQKVYNIEVEDNHNYVVFTEMLTPLWVANCHAAIVSRELGIPCVVGTSNATEVLKDGMLVTVNAYAGEIYEGEVTVKEPGEGKVGEEIVGEEEIEALKKAVKGLACESCKPEMSEKECLLAILKEHSAKVKVNVALPEVAKRAGKTGADGVGLLRAEHMITAAGMHPAEFIRQGRQAELVAAVKKGIKTVLDEFKGKPVWYRTFDARTDEFKQLKGGEKEPEEDNPMLGWHGIRRDLDQEELPKAQFIAIKELVEEGYRNIGVMLPFLQSVEEFKKAKEIAEEVGLKQEKSVVEFGVMVETPAACWIIEELVKQGLDFISFGTNDLTQLTLGIDRNNERIQKAFTELHPAVLGEIEKVIMECKKHRVETSICGQAGSNPEMVQKLVRMGISSVSANIDAVQNIKQVVLMEEKNRLLGR